MRRERRTRTRVRERDAEVKDRMKNWRTFTPAEVERNSRLMTGESWEQSVVRVSGRVRICWETLNVKSIIDSTGLMNILYSLPVTGVVCTSLQSRIWLNGSFSLNPAVV